MLEYVSQKILVEVQKSSLINNNFNREFNMKCQSCGAIVAASADACEFCGTSMSVSNSVKMKSKSEEHTSLSSTSDNNLSSTIQKKVSFAEDSFNLISELKETEKNPFNWLAFFFPVAFLAGYGSTESAKKIALVILIPVLVMSIVKEFSYSLASSISVAIFVWTFYVDYLVSTRQDKMTKKDKPYNLGAGILYQVIFIIIYSIFQKI